MTTQEKKPKSKQKIGDKAAFRALELKLEQLLSTSGRFDQAERAARVNRCGKLCEEAFRLGKYRDTERRLWERAAALFNKALAEAYPPHFWEDFSCLKKGDVSGLETAIKFLENDPVFFRSGYVKADLLKFISHIEVPEEYRPRLKNILLDAVSRRGGREFRHYCRLSKFTDKNILRKDLDALALNSNPAVRRRARWVIESLKFWDER